MSRLKLLQQLSGVILITMLLVGCGGSAATPVSEAPIPTATPVPPTSTPTPEVTTGIVQGKLIGAESQQPLTGAAVVLCLVVGEKTCVLQADLVSISGEDGKFELTEVLPGSYVVLYDPSAKASSSWKEIDGLEMILKLEGLSGFPSSARTELFSTFGGGGGIRFQKGTTLEFKDGVVVGGDGSIRSEKYGLTMDFHEGKPITIEIQLGKITELEIRAWAQ